MSKLATFGAMLAAYLVGSINGHVSSLGRHWASTCIGFVAGIAMMAYATWRARNEP